jgi:hypothetical protein
MEFWIGIVLAIIGIFISWLAYKEAHKAFDKSKNAEADATTAKEAAIKAAKTVKKQTTVLSIAEIIRLCQMRGNTNYEDSNTKLTEICGKVGNIIEIYRNDLVESHQNLLQQIEECASNVFIEFNLLDRGTKSGEIYSKIRPIITTLVILLNKLQGVLENELIKNN